MKNKHRFQIYRLLNVLGFMLIIAYNNGVSQTLTINGVAPTLTINAGTPGGQLTAVSNANCFLRYSTPNNPNVRWRITVSTSNTSPLYTLSVLALNPTAGTAGALVTLNSSTATNFVTNIRKNKTNATCYLQYTASATFAAGIGTDTHTVTYTLLQP